MALDVCLHAWAVELDAGQLLRLRCECCGATVGGILRRVRGRRWAIELTVLDYGRRGLSTDDLAGAGAFLAQRRARAA